MEAHELRIGNLVYFPVARDIVKIDQAILCDFANGFIFIKAASITEEILLKFGFEKRKDFDVYTNVWELGGFMVSLGEYINIHVDWADDGDDNYHSIVGYEELRVHTLQNLYFALTRKELTFNK